jgi:hypothetical protein
MPTDLPERIRDALRADEIGAADLHQPVLRPPPPGPTRSARLVAATAAAAAVAAIAVVVPLLATGHGADPAATQPAVTQPDAMAGVRGYRWDVTGLHDAHGTLAVPQALRADIGFARTGVVLGRDGVNTLTGRYRATATGYRVTDTAMTAIGAVGPDPVRDRVTAAVDAMFAVGRTGAPGLAVTVALSGNSLRLRQGATALTLVRAGTQPDAGMASAPATGTSATSAGSAACAGGRTQRGFTLSIASGPRGASSPEAAVRYFVEHNRDLGFGGYDGRAWSVRRTSTDAANATSPHGMLTLVQLPGKGWYAESGYSCS